MEGKDRPEYLPGYVYLPKKAKRVIDFIERFCRHARGEWAGKPFILLPWQRDFIESVYGWYDAEGNKRFRQAALFISKKNGKSSLGACLALADLLLDRRPMRECISCAADRHQASIVFRECAAIVRSSPDLADVLKIVDSRSTIMYPKTMSRYYCLSGDHHRSEGINASSIIFDETHTQKDSRLWDAVRYATASQRDPLLLSLSTAGAEKKPGLPWWDLWTYCERVAADPSVDPRFYGKIYEAPEVEDEDKYFTDEKMWRSANPSLGETITLDSFRADAQEAKNTRTRRNAFLRYRLNRPVALDGRFINMGAWARNAKEWSAPLEGRECVGAIDLASTRDLSCFLCLFPWENGEGFDVFSKFWVPSDSMRERCVRDGVQYDRWNADGHLETTTGNVTDYNYIRKFIVDFSKKHNVKKIAVDRWAAQSTIVELAGEGVEMLGWGQGFASMSEGTKLLETYLEQEKLFHKGHPVLEWNASNLCVDEDAAGNIKPSRKRSTEKIDGMVCLSMAIGLHATTEKQASQDWNIYEL